MPHDGGNAVQPDTGHASNLLLRLRAGTQAAHARTEALPGLLCLMSPELTRAQYGVALAGLLEFHASLHHVLPPRLARLGVDFQVESGRLAALRRDIAWAGGSAAPRRRRVALGRGAAAIGALYVLEGSSLGGRVIGRQLARSLNVAPGRGGDFFCGLDADTARRRWAALCAVLGGLPPRAAPAVLRGACAAFALLEAVFAAPHMQPVPPGAYRSAVPAMPAAPAAPAVISY